MLVSLDSVFACCHVQIQLLLALVDFVADVAFKDGCCQSSDSDPMMLALMVRTEAVFPGEVSIAGGAVVDFVGVSCVPVEQLSGVEFPLAVVALNQQY